MTRAVLDTNVLVSAIAGAGRPASTPGELLRRWHRREYQLVLSEHILTELERTLVKPFYRKRLTPTRVDRAMRTFRKRADIAPITVTISGIASHPADDRVLATAVSAQVEYLVTGDHKLQAIDRYEDIVMLSPRAFLSLLEQQSTT